MKIALIEKISEKQHHFKSQIIYNIGILSNQIPVVSPIFRRQIARIMTTFYQIINNSEAAI